MEWMLFTVVATALVFDFTNGFHDAANAIATSISTRALSMNSALTLAAILNVVGGMLSTVVAMTIATGIVVPSVVSLPIVLAGLLGAIFWNLLTWYGGLPSSSSHCLVGVWSHDQLDAVSAKTQRLKEKLYTSASPRLCVSA